MRFALILMLAAACCGAELPNLGGVAKTDAKGRVTSLNLRSTWINDSDLLEVARLTDLTDLDLSETRITDLGFQHLKPLSNVSTLNLYYTEQIGDGALAAVRDWKQLKHLNLCGTKVTDAGLVHLAGLPIESLNVGFSLFTDNGFDSLVNLPQLKRLAVGGNKVTDVGLNSLRLLPNLIELDLSGAQRTDSGMWAATITDRALETIDSLVHLEVLNVRGAKFTDAGFPKLARTKELRKLNLGETTLSAKGLSALGAFPKLETLGLYKAGKIDDAIFPILSGLPSLKWVDLSETGVTEAGVNAFKAAHPVLTVLWEAPVAEK